MFVRIAWRKQPAEGTGRKDLRPLVCPPRGPRNDLGISARDFSNMTKSLFDRLD